MPCVLSELFLAQVSRGGNEVALQTTSEVNHITLIVVYQETTSSAEFV